MAEIAEDIMVRVNLEFDSSSFTHFGMFQSCYIVQSCPMEMNGMYLEELGEPRAER